MARPVHHTARQRDAAFFEDWSPWANLDGLPERPRRDNGQRIIWGNEGLRDWSRYYCLLRHNMTWMGGPCFEIAIPPSASIEAMLLAVPGCRKPPPAAYRSLSRRGPGRDDTYYVPAENWPHLRRALPAIQTATEQWVRRK